jgi:hypothetical protein
MTQLDAVRDAKHMDQVAFLKTTHEMGHGHANAIVAVYRQINGHPVGTCPVVAVIIEIVPAIGS